MIKRYEPALIHVGTQDIITCVLDPIGDFVRYEDYEAEISLLKAELEQLMNVKLGELDWPE